MVANGCQIGFFDERSEDALLIVLFMVFILVQA
jgi:hypothetical protein